MATVPVFPSLGDALNTLAPSASLEARHAVGGGDINRAYRLTLSDGTDLFVKANASSLLPMFEAEAEGLADRPRDVCRPPVSGPRHDRALRRVFVGIL